MVKYIFTIIIAATLLPGCITASYHRSTEEYGSPRREFSVNPGGGYRVIRGICEGRREVGGEPYYFLQFRGLLKGERRFLDVMVPVKPRVAPAVEVGPDGNLRETKRMLKRPGDVTFRESASEVVGGTPAYLIFRETVDMGSDFTNFFLSLEAGRESDPQLFFKRINRAPGEAKYPLGAVVLDFANTQKYLTDAVIWNRDPGGKTVVECLGIDYDEYRGPRLDIAWKERSRVIYLLRQGGYAGTVIADVVTSPVQLVMLILTALSGPGVR